jgi:hypothetical protein
MTLTKILSYAEPVKTATRNLLAMSSRPARLLVILVLPLVGLPTLTVKSLPHHVPMVIAPIPIG